MVVDSISTKSEKMYKCCVTNGRNINTTDECYTPPAVYDTVLDYAVDRYHLQGKHIVRPFIPGGDYQKYAYDKNDVVIDNPPSTHHVTFSEREKAIIEKLNKRSGD